VCSPVGNYEHKSEEAVVSIFGTKVGRFSMNLSPPFSTLRMDTEGSSGIMITYITTWFQNTKYYNSNNTRNGLNLSQLIPILFP
jgi:hypothetical protein